MTTLRQYDAINRLTGISHQASGGAVVSSHGYAYNSANQRHTVTNADQSYWVYQFDSLAQVTSGKRYWSDATPVAGQQFEYQFDEIGNRLQAKHGGNASGQNLRTNDYSPNALNQYAAIVDPGYRDVIGRSTKTVPVTVNGQTAERKYEYFRGELSVTNAGGPVWQEVTISGGTNRTGHLLVSPRNQSPIYDADGNLTSDGLWTYSWDGENRLVGMESQTNVVAGARKRLTLGYDHQGRRIRKQVETWNGGDWQAVSERRFAYDGWNLIAELSSDLSPLTSYLWGLDLSGTPQGAGGVGGLLSVAYTQSPATSHFICYDGNGNVVTLVNAADDKASAQYEYGPFGEMIRATGPMAQTNVFRWSTKYTDDETDLVYYGYRYYHTSTGQWLSRDPIREEGGPNLYGFVYNNPCELIDSEGLAPRVNGFVYDPKSRTARATYDQGLYLSKAPNGPAGSSAQSFLMMQKIMEDVPVCNENTLYLFSVYVLYGAAAGMGSVYDDPGAAAIAQVQEWSKLGTGAAIGTFEGWIADTRRACSLVLVLAPMGKCCVSGAAKTGASVEAQLRAHLDSAVARFEAENFTRAQATRLVDNPNLEAAFRGERIDTFFKEAVRADPNLQHLQVTPRFRFGPDVFDPTRNVWYDVTVPTQWQNHVFKYQHDFGQGIPLFYP